MGVIEEESSRAVGGFHPVPRRSSPETHLHPYRGEGAMEEERILVESSSEGNVPPTVPSLPVGSGPFSGSSTVVHRVRVPLPRRTKDRPGVLRDRTVPQGGPRPRLSHRLLLWGGAPWSLVLSVVPEVFRGLSPKSEDSPLYLGMSPTPDRLHWVSVHTPS